MPGLAMSRSLGDLLAHTVGVSSLPEVISYQVGIDDKFIVIGSDGVFEFLSN
jgi:serine/threonine protein phosphatase PrpC